ncbi:D-alanine--D-alanine ligase [Leucobacter albus]|uniref:D-alanine--D-alanine ligase n=1 Tax=Leucobacter albus TaxID=272210 RepID=A0ABW3TK83_9MICO
MRIAVLFGGDSEERDVSIASAAEIIPALRSRGHSVRAVDTLTGALALDAEKRVLGGMVGVEPPAGAALAAMRQRGSALRLPREIGESDLVFLALHGGSGDDGRLQALLELAGIPYTGSGPLGSGLAMDKHVSKTLLRANGIATPDWLLAPTGGSEAQAELELPVVVKPTRQGSTVGLPLVRVASELTPAIARAARYGPVMIERFVAGRELTVGVLGGDALAIGEVHLDAQSVFSYSDKYQAGAMRASFPALLDDAARREVEQMAVQAHRIHQLEGNSLSDLRLDVAGQPWLIEVNRLPGTTATSLLPQSAAAAGVDFASLCERIARLGVAR